VFVISGIRLLAAVTNTTAVVLTGADTLSGTTNASGVGEFFAYPTSTTRGVVTLTFDGDITQVYITGNAGPAYDIGTVTYPSLAPKGKDVIVAVVTDAFGNAVTAGTLGVTRVGTGAGLAGDDIIYSSTTKRWEGSITAGETAGSLAVGITIFSSGTTALKASTEQVAAFGAANSTAFGIIQVVTAKTVAMLTAEIAALQTQLAATTTKAKYNKLAKRWNKANPSKKVALLK
jgi:hypothetical protein